MSNIMHGKNEYLPEWTWTHAPTVCSKLIQQTGVLVLVLVGSLVVAASCRWYDGWTAAWWIALYFKIWQAQKNPVRFLVHLKKVNERLGQIKFELQHVEVNIWIFMYSVIKKILLHFCRTARSISVFACYEIFGGVVYYSRNTFCPLNIS